MCYGTDLRNAYTFLQELSSLFEIVIDQKRSNHTNFGIRRHRKLDFHLNALTYPEIIYGAFPEPFWKVPQFQFRIQYGVRTFTPSILRITPGK